MALTPSLEELRKLTDDELIARYDAKAERTVVGVDFYLAELRAREAARVARTMARLTWFIAALTLVVTIATVLALLFS